VKGIASLPFPSLAGYVASLIKNIQVGDERDE